MIIKLFKSRPYWLHFGYWKLRRRIAPIIRRHFECSYMMIRRWNTEFASEIKPLFDGCRFNPQGAPFSSGHAPIWKGVFQNRATPHKILEIGSWQGSSTVVWAAMFADAHITCIDTWQGSDSLDMNINPEELFDFNTAAFAERVRKIKSDSVRALVPLDGDGKKLI